jgi:FKBP-type peptidyl-prolyl cis-trans isomerase 2
MQVAKGHVVRVEYELKVKGGDVIESSAKTGPITYTHGEGKMLAALEKRLEGMKVGERKSGEIAGDEAFGPETALPTTKLTRAQFPADEKLEVAKVFSAHGISGIDVELKVLEIQGDAVTARLMHPLFHKTLEYSLRVTSIEDTVAHKREHLPPPPPPAAALKINVEEVKE